MSILPLRVDEIISLATSLNDVGKISWQGKAAGDGKEREEEKRESNLPEGQIAAVACPNRL